MISSAISIFESMEEKRRLPNVRGSGHSLFRRSRKEDRIYFKWARVFLQLGSSDNILGVSVRREGEGVDSETSNQIRKQCPYTNGQKPVCNDSKFRNIDGSCNQKVNKPKMAYSGDLTKMARLQCGGNTA